MSVGQPVAALRRAAAKANPARRPFLASPRDRWRPPGDLSSLMAGVVEDDGCMTDLTILKRSLERAIPSASRSPSRHCRQELHGLAVSLPARDRDRPSPQMLILEGPFAGVSRPG
jgi:hypothetical protein